MKKIDILILIILIGILFAVFFYFRDFGVFEPKQGLLDENNLDAVCQKTEIIENKTEDYSIEANVCVTGISEIDSDVNNWLDERELYTIENAEELKNLGSAAKPELLVNSETFDYSDTIKSLKIDVYEYQGGAHGMTDYETFVFNKQTAQVFGLQEFFREQSSPLQIIYPIVKEKLMGMSEYMEEDWVLRGTGNENFDNYKNFILDGNNLVFIFPAYQVGPYALGPQKVSIPFSELSAILSPEFFEPTAKCKASHIDDCPAGCIVCPPCEVCSSMGCDLAEFCLSIGFDVDWYEMIKKQRENIGP